MKILVTGGRDYRNAQFVRTTLDELLEENPITMVIQGGASGVDTFAARWAADRGIQYATVPALWNKHGKSAGYLRNAAMLQLMLSTFDLIVAFPGGKGTAMMVKLAQSEGHKIADYRARGA